MRRIARVTANARLPWELARFYPLRMLGSIILVALLLDEPEAEEFRAAVEEDTTRLVSVARFSARDTTAVASWT